MKERKPFNLLIRHQGQSHRVGIETNPIADLIQLFNLKTKKNLSQEILKTQNKTTWYLVLCSFFGSLVERERGRKHFGVTNISVFFFILHSNFIWMPVHLISVSISVELWLIGSSCPKHCIWSHIGLQDLLQEGHIFNVQTALKGQWNEDWLSVLQGEQAGARTAWQPGTCGLPSHQDWRKKMRHRCHLCHSCFIWFAH